VEPERGLTTDGGVPVFDRGVSIAAAAFGYRAVRLAQLQPWTLLRIDPRTLRVRKTIPPPTTPALKKGRRATTAAQHKP
jgi:hypothetical protein